MTAITNIYSNFAFKKRKKTHYKLSPESFPEVGSGTVRLSSPRRIEWHMSRFELLPPVNYTISKIPNGHRRCLWFGSYFWFEFSFEFWISV